MAVKYPIDSQAEGANLVRQDATALAMLAHIAEHGPSLITELPGSESVTKCAIAVAALVLAGYVFPTDDTLFPTARGTMEYQRRCAADRPS